MAAEREDWRAERKMLNRWALWCCNGDERTIRLLCGLTPAGSPHTIMDRLWDYGAVNTESVTGYAKDAPPAPDIESPAVDAFMVNARELLPAAHTALTARHRRIVNGELIVMRSEQWMARVIYGKSSRLSWNRLAGDCVAGYAALRVWMHAQRSNGRPIDMCTLVA